MSQTELNRVLVLQRVVEGQLSVQEAALIMGISERHVWRLKVRLKSFGPAALAHGNRGHKLAHAIPDHIRRKAVELAQTKYRGCNYTFLSELLGRARGHLFKPFFRQPHLEIHQYPQPQKT